MSDQTNETCRAAIQRLVESDGGPLDRDTEQHVRSCMSCFRAMSDLRDLPRVADALKAEAPEARFDDRFWEALASRTTDAVSAALAGEAEAPRAVPSPRTAPPRRAWRARLVSFGALAAAAAAGWMFMVRHPVPPRPEAAGSAAFALGAGRLAGDDGSEAFNDVADLDANALRALLDRLGRHAPTALASGTGDETDAADVPSDDEWRVSDEVADLDGDGLRRVATSLTGAAL